MFFHEVSNFDQVKHGKHEGYDAMGATVKGSNRECSLGGWLEWVGDVGKVLDGSAKFGNSLSVRKNVPGFLVGSSPPLTCFLSSLFKDQVPFSFSSTLSLGV